MELILHQSFNTLKNLASAWNALLDESVTRAPFLRFEYLHTWWCTRGGGEWPEDSKLAVITAHQGDELIGIAPLFLTRNNEGQNALMLLGSIEISDFLDLIVRPGDLEAFSSALLGWLQTSYPEPWQLLDFYNIPESSPSLAVLKKLAEQFKWEYEESIYQPSPYIPLPGDFQIYLSQIDKKQRHELRRKMRRAYESGHLIRWYIVDNENDLSQEMDTFLGLMAKDPVKAYFLSTPMRVQMKKTAEAAFKAGYLQLAFLVVDEEKASAYLSFDFDNKIWVYNSGIDPVFMDLSAGWVLLGSLIEWANEHQRREFDFLRGPEDYKYKLGGKPRNVMRVRIAHPQTD